METKKTMNILTSGKKKIAILGRYNNENYGGKLTVLSTYETVKELGFSPKMMRLKSHNDNSDLLYNKLCEFTKSYLNNPVPPKGWNNHFDGFLLCSDWTLNKQWFLPPALKLFDWVDDGKNIVSFSSSFGNISGGYTPEDYPMLSKRLNRFTSLSVREESGVELCKKVGANHAVQIPDPVFSQKKEFYIKIAEISSHKNFDYKYAAVYALDMKPECVDLAIKLAKKLGLKPVFIVAHKDREIIEQIRDYDYVSEGPDGVSAWIYYLSNSDYIITNSFHGLCLSLILKKDFTVIDRKGFSNLRVVSLLSQFGLEKKFIRNADDIAVSVEMSIDWDKTNRLLVEMYNKTREFLKSALKNGNSKYQNAQRIDSLPKNQCTGCLSCSYSCPQKFIIPTRDEKSGFIYPKINEQNCTNCGLCAKACPVIQNLKPEQQKTLVYCGFSLDEQIRYNSSSGGFFSELALKLLESKKAVVFGSAFETPSRICHIEITSAKDLPKIRQSKYVQSELRDAYAKIENYLNLSKTVMFCGTPCQCGAVKQYLNFKKINTENLYLIDFICHSVNSPYAYEAYLKDIERQNGQTIKSVWFRNKEKGWGQPSTRIDFIDSDKYYIKDKNEDDYYKGFLKYHLYSRPSCSACRFKGIERISDITLGDAWGVNIDKNKYHGVSTAIIHSDKGQKLFDDIKSKIYFEQKLVDMLKKGNVNLLNSIQPGVHSEYFYSRLSQNVPFSQIIKEIETGQLVKTDIQQTKSQTPKMNEAPKQEKKFVIPERVTVNGAVIRAHPSAQIVMEKGAKLTLNNDLFPGSSAECLIDLREGAKLAVKGNFKIYYSCRIVVHKNAVLTLGNGYLNTGTKIICHNNIEIGDAIVAPDCYIIDSDFHTILNSEGKVINPPAPIKFEGHVWLGQNVTVLKGVTIGNGSCIGAKSLVARDIPPNSLAAGNPARVIKTDIQWK